MCPEREFPDTPLSYPDHLNPVFCHPGPGPQAVFPEARADDTAGCTVNMGGGSTDRMPCDPSLSVLLGPDGAQAFLGHHLLEEAPKEGYSVTDARQSNSESTVTTSSVLAE